MAPHVNAWDHRTKFHDTYSRLYVVHHCTPEVCSTTVEPVPDRDNAGYLRFMSNQIYFPETAAQRRHQRDRWMAALEAEIEHLRSTSVD